MMGHHHPPGGAVTNPNAADSDTEDERSLDALLAAHQDGLLAAVESALDTSAGFEQAMTHPAAHPRPAVP
jgi:hypothetical protein